MPRYKFANAHEWLADAWDDDRITWGQVQLLLSTLDADTIQEHFQDQMEDDGYFVDLDKPAEADEIDWSIEELVCPNCGGDNVILTDTVPPMAKCMHESCYYSGDPILFVDEEDHD